MTRSRMSDGVLPRGVVEETWRHYILAASLCLHERSRAWPNKQKWHGGEQRAACVRTRREKVGRTVSRLICHALDFSFPMPTIRLFTALARGPRGINSRAGKKL
jgi:hypothetical protein